MKVIIGKTAGFCFGVKRAVDTSLSLPLNKQKKIYCLGELVHNKEVIQTMEAKGIKVIENIDDIKDTNSVLIIRAHGVDKKIHDKALNKGFEVIDLTCPFVAKIHDVADEYQKQGYYVFLIGNKSHPEILGTSSYCGKNYSIIEEEADIPDAIQSSLKMKIKNLLIIVQTTFSKLKFRKMEAIIRKQLGNKINIITKDTICMATEERQKETDELSQKVDLMIIIGGKNSSNTSKLYEIAKKNTQAILIETSRELDMDYVQEYQTIGIMAGASTPQDSIDDVVNKLKMI